MVLHPSTPMVVFEDTTLVAVTRNTTCHNANKPGTTQLTPRTKHTQTSQNTRSHPKPRHSAAADSDSPQQSAYSIDFPAGVKCSTEHSDRSSWHRQPGVIITSLCTTQLPEPHSMSHAHSALPYVQATNQCCGQRRQLQLAYPLLHLAP